MVKQTIEQMKILDRELQNKTNSANVHAMAQIRTLVVALISQCEGCNKCKAEEEGCEVFKQLITYIEQKKNKAA
jgi:hypothetical protein